MDCDGKQKLPQEELNEHNLQCSHDKKIPYSSFKKKKETIEK